MSTLKVNTVLSADTPTVNITDGLNVTGVSTVANITATTVTSTNIVNSTQLSNRNIIINGAMQVAQRGTSSTTSGIQTVDRYNNAFAGTDEAPTQAQVDVAAGTTPYTLGFRKAYKITNGNQTSGAGAADYCSISYKLESQDISNSGWNYVSSSSNITLSFWVKSSVAQNFYGYLYANNGSRLRSFETGSLSADTWTKITKTIPGDSNLVFNNDNAQGLQIHITQFWGTDYTDGSHSLNTWGALDNSSRTPNNTSTWYTTNDATFELTGVQLEVGSVATPFEHRSYADELIRCQRYCELIVRGASKYINNSVGYASNALYAIIRFAVEKRTTPTLSHTSGSEYYQNWHNGTGTDLNGFSGVSWPNKQASAIYATSTVDAKEAGLLGAKNASAEILFTAEL